MRNARKRLLQERLAMNLWLVPAFAASIAVIAAKALTQIDRAIPQHLETWYLFAGQADSARELLSTIASSLMTFTGVVFSITILVLQLASSQFSPRVLQSFLEDRVTRVSMGVFIGSFVYAMALLPEVRDGAGEKPEFVPALSIFIAFLVTLLSVGVFARYISHMAQSIRTIHVVRRVADTTRATIDELFLARPPAPAPLATVPAELPDGAGQVVPNLRRGGVITSVDEERIIEAAAALGTVVEIIPQVGDFVPHGAPLVRICADRLPDSSAIAELVGCVLLADERTAHQDPGFGFRQLVDIAERALSPAVNDPTSAVQALDQIHDLLRTLAVRRFPGSAHLDRAGKLRLILRHPEWDAFVHLAFDEIRQYGQGSIQVLRRMRGVLQDLLTVAPPERRPALQEQLDLLDRATDHGFASPRERELARKPGTQDA